MSAAPGRVQRLRQKAGRWAVGPLLVRVLLLVVTLAALGLAMPSAWILSRFMAVLVIAAVVVALVPRGRFVSIMLVGAVVLWLAATTAFHEDIVVWRLVALAAAMYLVHTLAALAAVLPYDAVLPPGAVAGWLLRGGLTLVVSAGLGLFAMIEAPLVIGPVYLTASIGGVIVTGALVWVLVRAARR